VHRCESCLAGPDGIEGHKDLFAYRMTGSKIQFKCRDCESFWTRNYRGEGGFDWMQLRDELPGAPVPGWRPR
jgi:hypothetical protein